MAKDVQQEIEEVHERIDATEKAIAAVRKALEDLHDNDRGSLFKHRLAEIDDALSDMRRRK